MSFDELVHRLQSKTTRKNPPRKNVTQLRRKPPTKPAPTTRAPATPVSRAAVRTALQHASTPVANTQHPTANPQNPTVKEIATEILETLLKSGLIGVSKVGFQNGGSDIAGETTVARAIKDKKEQEEKEKEVAVNRLSIGMAGKGAAQGVYCSCCTMFIPRMSRCCGSCGALADWRSCM